MRGTHSTILASGTLDDSEMGRDFSEKRRVRGELSLSLNESDSNYSDSLLPLSPLSTGHVIDADQIFVRRIATLVNGSKFTSDFNSTRGYSKQNQNQTEINN